MKFAEIVQTLTTSNYIMRNWFDVKAYGAQGDGITDDRAAVQEAITAASSTAILNEYGWGAVVFLPKGVYKVTSTLTAARGVGVQGSGRRTSQILIAHPDATADGLVWNSVVQYGRAGFLRDVAVMADATTHNGVLTNGGILADQVSGGAFIGGHYSALTHTIKFTSKASHVSVVGIKTGPNVTGEGIRQVMSTKAPYNRTPKQVGILDKIRYIKASGAVLGTPRLPATVAAANDNRNNRPGIRTETSTVYSGNDKEEGNEDNDDNHDLPTIEDLLYTTLKKEGFATEDSSSDHRVRGVGEVAVKKRGGFTDHNRSALGQDSGGSPDNPIILLGDDNLSISKAEVDHGSLRVENAESNAGHFDSPDAIVDSTLAPPSSLDGWYDIDDFPEMVQRLRLAEGTLMSNSIRPYSPFSHLSNDCIDTEGLDTHRFRSEATASHSARPRSPPSRRSRTSIGDWLGQEDRLHAGRNIADEREYEDELARPALNTDTFDKGERQQQEAKAEGKVNKDDDEDDSQVQQAENGVAAAVTAKRIGDNHLSGKEDGSPGPAERQRLLPSQDPEPGHDGTESGSDGNGNNELSNRADSDKDNGRLRPAKRRRRSSSYDAQCPRSINTIFSGNLPINIDLAPNPIRALQSRTPFIIKVQESLQYPVPRVDCIRQHFQHYKS
ncbi:MAG: hypothetical protein M1839_003221 [Geoglossum umbratile]|nr:MAG: hypothetical protein M1839_003221 [Geoglossum umbratile]